MLLVYLDRILFKLHPNLSLAITPKVYFDLVGHLIDYRLMLKSNMA